MIRQAERDRVAPDDVGHDRRAAAARGSAGVERREVRERGRAERDGRQRQRRAATADEHARDRRRGEHERRHGGQEAAAEAPLALFRPGTPRRPDADGPRDDDGDGLRLRDGAQDPRRCDLGPAARGYADALALDEREVLRSRVATATCLDSGHAFILVRSPVTDPGPRARDLVRYVLRAADVARDDDVEKGVAERAVGAPPGDDEPARRRDDRRGVARCAERCRDGAAGRPGGVGLTGGGEAGDREGRTRCRWSRRRRRSGCGRRTAAASA